MTCRTTRFATAAALVTLCLVPGCEDASGPGDAAYVKVLLTDAPSDMIASAEVWISRIYLVPGAEGDGGSGAQDLFNDPANPQQYDLLELRGGVTADLTGEVGVEPGAYAQLRIVVDSAFITLADDYTFEDGTNRRTLKVPSGAQSGIKVQLDAAVAAETGESTTLTVDFDVDRNFVVLGNPDTPAGIKGILFTPVLTEHGRTRR